MLLFGGFYQQFSNSKVNNSPLTDYYQLFGVAPTASEAEIKAAYRRLALRWHPDRNGGDAAAEAQFKGINEAYQTLGDPERRARYDLTRFYAAFGETPPTPRPRREPRRPPPPGGYSPRRPAYRTPNAAEWRLWGRWGVVIAVFLSLLILAKEPIDRWHGVLEWQAANRLLVEGDTTEALIQLSEAIFHQPDQPQAYRLRGELLLRRVGGEQLVYQDLKAALRYAPNDSDSDLRLDLGLICLRTGRPDEAELHLDRALRLDPRFVRAYLARGLARLQQKKEVAACEDWHQALGLGENAARELVDTYCK